MRSLIQPPAQSRHSYELRPSHTKLFPVCSWNPTHMGETAWPPYFTAWVSSAGKTSPTGISHLNLCLLTLFLLSCTMLKSLALFSPCHPCRQGAARVPPNHLCYRNKPKFLCPSSQCKHFSYWSNWRPILVASVEDTPEEWGYNLFPHSLRQVQMLLALLLPGSLLVHAQLVAHQHCGPLPQTRPNQAVTACLITKNSPLPAVRFCSYPFWIM